MGLVRLRSMFRTGRSETNMDVMALVMEMLMTTMTATETVHSVVH